MVARQRRSFALHLLANLVIRLDLVRSAVLSSTLRGWRPAGVALALAASLWCATAGQADALDLVVDTFGDSAASAFQACTPAAGDCTLRGAIIKANAVPGPHTITLGAGSYSLTLQGTDEDAAQFGDLDILQTVIINGVSPAATVVTWDEATVPVANRDRVFDVRQTGNLTVRNMSIRRGGSSTGSGGQIGGGIHALGPLTVERVSVRLNQGVVGGGIYIENTAVIRDSTININAADSGAGLFVQSVSPASFTVLIENSTISSNTAAGPGVGTGGGLATRVGNPDSVVTLNNVTVANNTAISGGGLSRVSAGTIALRNTIVANNTAPASPNCSGALVSQGFNLVWGSTETCGMSVAAGDLVNTGDPRLSPLQDGNGGPTATHALEAGSAALDRGSPTTPGSGGAACAATDQRGLVRAVAGTEVGVTRCDVGAVEGGRWFAVNTATDSNDASFRACNPSATPHNCSLRGAITSANAATAGSAAVITLPATGSGSPYRLTKTGANEDLNDTGDLDVDRDITIVGGGASTTIIDGNGTDRVFDVRPGSARAVRLQDLTVQNGNIATQGGGGIRAQGSAYLFRTRLRSNVAFEAGGLFLFSGASSTVVDSVISGNIANGASGTGGGVYTAGNLTVVNATIAANQVTAATFGGGLLHTSGTTVLANTTIAGNSVGSGGAGGGIYLTLGTVTARNTLVANNSAATGPNCGGSGTVASEGFNLVFGGGTCGFTQGTDTQNRDPKLGPLAFNGGPTETMALVSGSAAIDAGNPATPGDPGPTCTEVDQRGTARPVDGDAVGGPRCDIGAYEAAVCTTRPSVALGVLSGAPGRINVAVTAGSGNIAELRLHAVPQTNVEVSIGGLVNQSGELVVPIGAPTAQFSIRRANGTGAGTLPFDVVDGCGLWPTLAGGGPNAWPSGSSAVGKPPAPDPVPAPAPSSPAGCATQRPNVGLATVMTPGGQLRATLSARTSAGVSTNSLTAVRISSIANAAVTIDGSPVRAGQTVTLPPGTRESTLVVDRHAPGLDPHRATGVGLVVTDACGEWQTFVGSGTGG